MQIGILVDNLGPSQLAYSLISRANKLVTENPTKSVTVFYENICLPCLSLSFAQMNMAETYGLNWPMVATNLNTAQKLLKTIGPTKRLFYLWDLEWLRLQRREYRPLQEIYGNPKLELIVRSESHRKVVKDAWNKDSVIIEDFDMDKLEKVAIGNGNLA